MNNTNKIIGAVVALGVVSLAGWYFLGNKVNVNVEDITVEKIINHEIKDLALGHSEKEESKISLAVKSIDGKQKGNFFNLKLDSIGKASMKEKKIDLALNLKVDSLYKADGEMFKQDLRLEEFPVKFLFSLENSKMNARIELDEAKLISLIPDPQLKAIAGMTLPMYVNKSFFVDLDMLEKSNLGLKLEGDIFNEEKTKEILEGLKEKKELIDIKFTGDTKVVEGREVAKFKVNLDLDSIDEITSKEGEKEMTPEEKEQMKEMMKFLTKDLYIWVEGDGNLLAIEFKLHTDTKVLKKYDEEIKDYVLENGNYTLDVDFNSKNIEINNFDIWMPENPINVMDLLGMSEEISE